MKVNFNVPCVFSAESMLYPNCDGNISTEKIKGDETPRQLDCNHGFGSATYVTGCFGFFISSHVINSLIKKKLGRLKCKECSICKLFMLRSKFPFF